MSNIEVVDLQYKSVEEVKGILFTTVKEIYHQGQAFKLEIDDNTHQKFKEATGYSLRDYAVIMFTPGKTKKERRKLK